MRSQINDFGIGDNTAVFKEEPINFNLNTEDQSKIANITTNYKSDTEYLDIEKFMQCKTLSKFICINDFVKNLDTLKMYPGRLKHI